jgi:hypothetical protein
VLLGVILLAFVGLLAVGLGWAEHAATTDVDVPFKGVGPRTPPGSPVGLNEGEL